MAGCSCSAPPIWLRPTRVQQFKVDLLIVEIDTSNLHRDWIAQFEIAATAFSHQPLFSTLEMVVVCRQGTDVDQALDIEIIQLDKKPKTGYCRHHTVKGIANPFLQKLALQPGIHFAGGFIGTTLGHGALLAKREHRW